MIQVLDARAEFINKKIEAKRNASAPTTRTVKQNTATANTRGDYPDEHNCESWSQNYEHCRERDRAKRAASETSREGFKED